MKYDASYEVCDKCGYLRVESPHWLDEAYSRAIANADTGLIDRNITLANKISRVLYWLILERGKGHYLDAAGGYGILTRMMRDNGFDFYWADKYCENLVASGFEYNKAVGLCEAVTAVEVLEHVVDPKAFINEALTMGKTETLIFTTELYEGEPPKPKDWQYYSFETGQHIGFFQFRTLKKIAEDLGFNFASANGLHIFSKKPINQLLLNLLTNRYLSLFPAFLIRLLLGSKRISDQKEICKKIAEMKM
jgi:hypothetical protein